jgi:hypothetical protein
MFKHRLVTNINVVTDSIQIISWNFKHLPRRQKYPDGVKFDGHVFWQGVRVMIFAAGSSGF